MSGEEERRLIELGAAQAAFREWLESGETGGELEEAFLAGAKWAESATMRTIRLTYRYCTFCGGIINGDRLADVEHAIAHERLARVLGGDIPLAVIAEEGAEGTGTGLTHSLSQPAQPVSQPANLPHLMHSA